MYPYQELIDESLDAYPEGAPLDLNKFHRVLTETGLRTPVLWLLGDFSEFSGVVQSLEKRHVQNKELELHLGFRGLADRDYRFAAERFEQAQRLAGGDATSSYYRILALAYAGEQEEAERLLAQLRLNGKGGHDRRFWDYCTRTLGLKIDASPISLQ